MAGLAIGALDWSGRAWAQGTRRRVSVIMGVGQGEEGAARLRAFREGLEAAGWSLPHQLELEVSWTGGDPSRVQSLAEAALNAQPDVILATATPIAVALRTLSTTRPVVFVNLVDPVGAGLVKSFAMPGGTFTGLTNTEPALAGKWLELLKEIAPQVKRAGFLFHPDGSPYAPFRRNLEDAAQTLGTPIFDLPVSDPRDIDEVVSRCVGGTPAGLLVMTDLFTSAHYRAIVEAVARHGIPAMYPYRFFVAKGGLVSYSADLPALYTRAAGYVDRVLRGAKPADLPVQTPSKYELVVNLRTASTLGLQIPATIAARADEFID